MKGAAKNQPKLVLVNFTNKKTKTAVAVDNGVGAPKFKDLKKMIPLVVACVTIAHIGMFLIVSQAVQGSANDNLSNEPNMTDIDPDQVTPPVEFYDFTSNPVATTTIPSVPFVVLTGVISLLLWEVTTACLVPHLAIEVSFHRIIRLFLLTTVIFLQLFNSFLYVNEETLILETFLVFTLVLVEFSYHVLLMIYIFKFSRFVKEQRVKSSKFVKKAMSNNYDIANPFPNINIDYMKLETV